MTSSPGPIPRASTAVLNAWVPDPVATACSIPIIFGNSFSKVTTVPVLDWIRDQTPLVVVFTTLWTTFASICGQSGQRRCELLAGSPPRTASSLLLFEAALPAVGEVMDDAIASEPAVAVARKLRRVNLFLLMVL